MKSSILLLISILISGITVSSKSFDFSELEEKIERVFLKYFNESQTINQDNIKKFIEYISKNIDFKTDSNHHEHDHNEDHHHINDHEEISNSDETEEIRKQCFEKSLLVFKDLSRLENTSDFNLVNSFIIASIDECSNVEAPKSSNNSINSNVFFDEKRKTSTYYYLCYNYYK
jgi:hypothetical protein